jgi:hypothetical protein
MLAALLAWRLLRLARTLVLAGLLAALAVLAFHGQLGRILHAAPWRSGLSSIERSVSGDLHRAPTVRAR